MMINTGHWPVLNWTLVLTYHRHKVIVLPCGHIISFYCHSLKASGIHWYYKNDVESFRLLSVVSCYNINQERIFAFRQVYIQNDCQIWHSFIKIFIAHWIVAQKIVCVFWNVRKRNVWPISYLLYPTVIWNVKHLF